MGKTTGTFTDEKGHFFITVQEGEALIVSHIGYENISILAGLEMKIKLHPLVLKGKEVIVHAGLKDESLQKSTSSITVLDAQSLKRTDGNHFQDVMYRIPNFNSSGGTSRPRYFQIRGVGERSHYFAEGPPNFSVAFIMDDIDLSGLGMAGILYDLGQIEIFRGPQSAMYGPNALAGLIGMRSKVPKLSFESHARISKGSDNIQRLNGMINFPFGKLIALRIALEAGSQSGFRTNKFFNKTNTNGRKESIIRWRLLFSPNDNFNTVLTVIKVKLNNKYDAWAPDNNKELFTFTNQQGIDSQETNAISLRTNLIGNNLTLIVSRSETDLVHAYDGDWGNDDYWLKTPYNFNPDLTYWNYEFFDQNDRNRVNQTLEGRFSFNDFTVGVYSKYLEENDIASGWLYGGDASIGSSTFNFDAFACYGQMIKTVSEKIIITANLRKEINRINYFGTAQIYDWERGDYINLEPVQFNVNHNLTGSKLALQYFVQEKLNVYTSISKGYKAGGINQHPSLADHNRPFNPEFMVNFEFGLRKYTDKTSLHFTVFSAIRKDQQLSISSQQTVGDPNSFIFYTANATSGSLSGLELDGSYTFNSEFSCLGSIGILNSHVDAFTFDSDSGSTTTLGNRESAYAPKYTFNIAVNYEKDKGLFALARICGKDKFYFSDSNDNKSEPYYLLSGQLGYKFGDLSVKIWGKNIFDQRYATRGFYFGLEPIWNEELQDHEYPNKKYVSFGDPAHFGVTMDYRF